MMRKILAVTISLILLSVAVTSAIAAPNSTKKSSSYPKKTTYTGTILGDKGTKAPLTLALSQENKELNGTVYLDKGLYIDAGRCGGGYIPATVQSAKGEVNKYKPNEISASTAFKVSGFKVSIDLEGVISSDGDVLETEAKIDLPWLCGRDPVISGTLFKQH